MLIMQQDPNEFEMLLGKLGVDRMIVQLRVALRIDNFVLFAHGARLRRSGHKHSPIELIGFYIPGKRNLARVGGIQSPIKTEFMIPTETGQTELLVTAYVYSIHDFISALTKHKNRLNLWTSIFSLEYENTHMVLHEPSTYTEYDGLMFIDEALRRIVSSMPVDFLRVSYRNAIDFSQGYVEGHDVFINDPAIKKSLLRTAVAKFAQARDAFTTKRAVGIYDLERLVNADHAVTPAMYEFMENPPESDGAIFEKLREFRHETLGLLPCTPNTVACEAFVEQLNEIVEQSFSRIYEAS